MEHCLEGYNIFVQQNNITFNVNINIQTTDAERESDEYKFWHGNKYKNDQRTTDCHNINKTSAIFKVHSSKSGLQHSNLDQVLLYKGSGSYGLPFGVIAPTDTEISEESSAVETRDSQENVMHDEEVMEEQEECGTVEECSHDESELGEMHISDEIETSSLKSTMGKTGEGQHTQEGAYCSSEVDPSLEETKSLSTRKENSVGENNIPLASSGSHLERSRKNAQASAATHQAKLALSRNSHHDQCKKRKRRSLKKSYNENHEIQTNQIKHQETGCLDSGETYHDCLDSGETYHYCLDSGETYHPSFPRPDSSRRFFYKGSTLPFVLFVVLAQVYPAVSIHQYPGKTLQCPTGFVQHGSVCCKYVECNPGSRVNFCTVNMEPDTCQKCPPGTTTYDKTNSKVYTDCIDSRRDCPSETVPESYRATEIDPRACDKRCRCNTKENFCGFDPCNCRYKKCQEKHHVLQQNCGCSPPGLSFLGDSGEAQTLHGTSCEAITPTKQTPTVPNGRSSKSTSADADITRQSPLISQSSTITTKITKGPTSKPEPSPVTTQKPTSYEKQDGALSYVIPAVIIGIILLPLIICIVRKSRSKVRNTLYSQKLVCVESMYSSDTTTVNMNVTNNINITNNKTNITNNQNDIHYGDNHQTELNINNENNIHNGDKHMLITNTYMNGEEDENRDDDEDDNDDSTSLMTESGSEDLQHKDQV